MKIYKVKSREHKGRQQKRQVVDCQYQWCILYNATYPSYHDVMNMKTQKWCEKPYYFVALTYHHNLNKW